MIANIRMAKKSSRPICRRGTIAFMMDFNTICRPGREETEWWMEPSLSTPTGQAVYPLLGERAKSLREKDHWSWDEKMIYKAITKTRQAKDCHHPSPEESTPCSSSLIPWSLTCILPFPYSFHPHCLLDSSYRWNLLECVSFPKGIRPCLTRL